ncbi:MAG: beta-lactamase family protein [Chloroflexota bacterium]|nr:beta-lactamase family protein [Chloroflexota bacterium]
MLPRLRARLLLFLMLALVLSACDLSPQPTPTPRPQQSSTPGDSAPLPPPTMLTTLDVSATPRVVSNTPDTSVTPQVDSSEGQASAAFLAEVDGYLNDLLSKGQFSGSVLLARDGRVLLSKGYGMADIENDVPNSPRTKFRIASVTKQFTAMGVMLLQQEGKLNVQASVCEFIAECPETWQPITLHHLLTHTSGLPENFSIQDFMTLTLSRNPMRDGLEMIKTRPLQAAPGETYQYSNVGYNMLGYIIEQVSGRTYEEYLREKIWSPLGMNDTGQDHESLLVKRRATGYFSPTAKAQYLPIDLAAYAGGLYSTVEDLYKWDQALYTEQLLPKSVLDTVFTAHQGDYGYGWTINQGEWGTVLAHNGAVPGFVSNISRYPDRKATVIVLSNLEATPLAQVVADLTARVMQAQ